MKVYVLTRYWDNDEGYAEDFSHHTTVEKVFATKTAGVNYLKTVSVTDILCNECPSSDGWYIDESEGINTKFDSSGIVSRSFHARAPIKPPYEEYYEEANIEFTLEEMEVEE